VEDARARFSKRLVMWELSDIQQVKTHVNVKYVVHTGGWFYLEGPECYTQLSKLGALGTGLKCGVLVVEEPYYSKFLNGEKTVECRGIVPKDCSEGSVIGIALSRSHTVSLKAKLGKVHIIYTSKVRIFLSFLSSLSKNRIKNLSCGRVNVNKRRRRSRRRNAGRM